MEMKMLITKKTDFLGKRNKASAFDLDHNQPDKADFGQVEPIGALKEIGTRQQRGLLMTQQCIARMPTNFQGHSSEDITIKVLQAGRGGRGGRGRRGRGRGGRGGGGQGQPRANQNQNQSRSRSRKPSKSKKM